MKINKFFRNILIIIIIFLFIMPFNTVSWGEDANLLSAGDITSGAGGFIEAGRNQLTNQIKNGEEPLNYDNMQDLSDVIYNVLLVVGIIAAVIVGLIIGIKIMTGSAGQKAETKELLIPYIVGCVIIFGGFTIWKIVVDLLNQVQ